MSTDSAGPESPPSDLADIDEIWTSLMSSPTAEDPCKDADPPITTPEAIRWDFPRDKIEGKDSSGMAWVIYGKNPDGTPHDSLVEPVIMSDGFEGVPSSLATLWHGFECGLPIQAGQPYRFASALLEQGKDLIILGYEDRTASIYHNAGIAIDCINKAISERSGDAPLVVGGFSMGGIVTRYALAKMEDDGEDHQTSLYFSYDSPHRGAWIPISLQAFGSFFSTLAAGPVALMNSPASRQMLSYHIENYDQDEPPAAITCDPMRTEFLEKLREVGWFPEGTPERPMRRVGVANGTGTGQGLSIQPGDEALKFNAFLISMAATLWAQAEGDDVEVAWLKKAKVGGFTEYTRRTTGIADFDSAPGGTLETFKIAAEGLKANNINATFKSPICFVPTVSAIALRDPVDHASLYNPVAEGETGELDEFLCSSVNTAHTVMTEELGNWLIAQILK